MSGESEVPKTCEAAAACSAGQSDKLEKLEKQVDKLEKLLEKLLEKADEEKTQKQETEEKQLQIPTVTTTKFLMDPRTMIHFWGNINEKWISAFEKRLFLEENEKPTREIHWHIHESRSQPEWWSFEPRLPTTLAEKTTDEEITPDEVTTGGDDQ